MKSISIVAALLSLVALNLCAANKTETISPNNLSPTVKFYSTFAGEVHNLKIAAASGYRFKSGPYISVNNSGLWWDAGGGNFKIADMSEQTQVDVKIEGVLERAPSGDGGGDPEEWPFTVNAFARYFTMQFAKPQTSKKVVAPQGTEDVEVTLVNAIGAPASGTVAFSSQAGSFQPSQASVSSGKATTTLNAEPTGGERDKITADASQVDITDGQKASGQKKSHEIADPKTEKITGWHTRDENTAYEESTSKDLQFKADDALIVVKKKDANDQEETLEDIELEAIDLTPDDSNGDIKNLIKWEVKRDPSDSSTGSLPTITPDSGYVLKAKLSTNAKGLFYVTLYCDADQSGSFNEKEELGVFSVALIPVELKDVKGEGTSDDEAIVPWDTTQDIANKNIAWIEAHTSDQNPAPRMPQLEFRMPGLPQGITIEAKLEVKYDRGNGARTARNQSEDTVKIPSNGSSKQVSSDTWQIWSEYQNEDFFGGNATLSYRLKNGSTEIQPETKIQFRIGGKNPDDTRCRAYIETLPNAGPSGSLWFAYAIAKSESKDYNGQGSRYNQFLELPAHTQDVGRPLWGNDGGTTPGGYGMFQVTGNASDSTANIPRKQIWNWQENVAGGLAILADKQSTAVTWMNQQKMRIMLMEQLCLITRLAA